MYLKSHTQDCVFQRPLSLEFLATVRTEPCKKSKGVTRMRELLKLGRLAFHWRSRVRLATVASAMLLTACGEPPLAQSVAKPVQPVPGREVTSAPNSGPGIMRPFPVSLRASHSAQVVLGPLAASAMPNPQSRPLQTGVARDIAQTRSGTDLRAALQWDTLPNGGRVAAITYTSSGAKGLRLGLLVSQLPAQAMLRFYAPQDPMAHEVPATEVLALLQLNKASGDMSAQARTYWSPTVAGEAITLEIHLPAGVSPERLDVGIGQLSHLF